MGNLAQDSPYSFRVSVWTNNTNNATGNIVNVTTLSLANFTVGFFDIEATNLDSRSIKFERIDINTTALYLNVTYPGSFNLTCNFHYKFAMTNTSFFNLANVPADGSDVQASFLFGGVDNEVIDVICQDVITNVSAPYLITQTNFLFLQQIADFRSGEFGTAGMFGAIDLITLIVVIIGMVGFNRVNESVGAIFFMALVGGLAFFEVIAWPTALTGAIAVVIMLVIASTRKP